MNTRWIIGLSSGSSADGVDAALLEIEGIGLDLQARLLQSLHRAYPAELRALLVRTSGSGPVDIGQVGLLHGVLGETFAAAARQVADQASFSLQQVQCIGYLGHMVNRETQGRFASILDLGMAALLAERTGITCIGDLRARDVAVGGEGTPLTALVDHLLFHDAAEHRVLLHLGGAATVVWLPRGGKFAEVLGFDASPCNGLLDSFTRTVTGGKEFYDAGGRHAVQGRCIEPLLQRWLDHPYLLRRPPKSLPPQEFGQDFAAQAVQRARQQHYGLHDLLCTATHFVARAIKSAWHRFLPEQPRTDRILLTGGGTRNGLLWQLLEHQFPAMKLERTDRLGIPAAAHKAAAVGVLAALTVDGVPGNLPAATGAGGMRLLGSITPGSSTNWARCLDWMAAQTSPLLALSE